MHPKKLFILAGLAALMLLPGRSAAAHASVIRSVPEQAAALAETPPEIVLTFTEPVDPDATHVEVVDGSGETVVPGPGTLDDDRITLHLPVDHALPDGIYSAVWQAISTVDTHVTYGTVAFTIGASTPPVSLLPAPGVPDPATAMPQTVDSVLRWLGYLSAALVVGAMLFAVLVWRPAGGGPQSGAVMTDLLRRLVRIGLAGLAVGTLGLLVVQAGQASGAGFPAVLGGPLLARLTSRAGGLVVVRLGLLGALAVLVGRMSPAIKAPRGWWIGAGLGLGILLTMSLQSHGAAGGQPLALAFDTLHLLAMTAWLGGLPALSLALAAMHRPETPGDWPEPATLIPAFSRVALVSVNLLAISGGYSALQQVQTGGALFGTTYGRALIVKSAVFALLLGLGAINLLVLTRRLESQPERTGQHLIDTTHIEIGLGLLLLLAVGVMIGSEPAGQAWDAQQRLGFLDSYREEGVKLVLRIAPNEVGMDEFGVDVIDHRRGADAAPATVDIRVHLYQPNLGVNQIDTTTEDGKRFSARGPYFTRPGHWRVDVILRRPGFDDVHHLFDVMVAEPR